MTARPGTLDMGRLQGWLVLVSAAVWPSGLLPAADWPTYRHDNQRTCITDEPLRPPLTGQWVFRPAHAPRPAWPVDQWDEAKTVFDRVFHVAVAGDGVYFGSSADGGVYALDARTGIVRWRFLTGGPIRIAPTVWEGAVYVGSDHGWAYALRADNGQPLWTFRAAPCDQRVIGHGAMISLWPIRTGVLVDQGIAYLAAGLFPSEGVYLYALNARTGQVVWKNDSAGAMYIDHPHPICDGFDGVPPQGALVVSDATLFVPTGRAVPAAFDRRDGRFLFWEHARSWRQQVRDGGATVWLADGALWTSPENTGIAAPAAAFDVQTGEKLIGTLAKQILVHQGVYFLLDRQSIAAVDAAPFQEEKRLLRELDPLKVFGRELSALEQARVAQLEAALKANAARKLKSQRWRAAGADFQTMILAGDVLYAGQAGRVTALAASTGQRLWEAPVEGTVGGLAAAGGRLFVSTDQGLIYAFGSDAGGPVKGVAAREDAPLPGPEAESAARTIAGLAGVDRGFALLVNIGDVRLALALAQRTNLKLIWGEPDGRQVQAAREALARAGLHGVRVTVDHVSADRLPYPPYFANLVLAGALPPSAAELVRVLRPCGGVLLVGPLNVPEAALRQSAESLRRSWPELDVKRVDEHGTWLKATRGPLAGAGQWTHQYANAAGTACSDDQRVRAPLSVAWFGQPGPAKSFKGQQSPLSLDGRLFLAGPPVQAYDAYNGTPLWETPVEKPGLLVATPDSLYVSRLGTDECLRLEAASGRVQAAFRCPASSEGGASPWGYLAVDEDLLIGTALSTFTFDEPDRHLTARLAVIPEVKRRLDQARSVVTLHHSRHEQIASMEAMLAAIDGAIGQDLRPGHLARYKSRLLRVLAGSSSRSVFALDRQTGRPRWTYDPGPRRYVCHASIGVADGRVFLVEGRETDGEAATKHLVALDRATGDKRYETAADLSSYCQPDKLLHRPPYRVLVNSTEVLSLAVKDHVLVLAEVWGGRRLFALSADDGRFLWSQPVNFNYYYLRRPVVVGRTVYTDGYAYDLHTGQFRMRRHPVTGSPEPWYFERSYGCGGVSGSARVLFFRSSVLSFFDLQQDEGITNFGGVRPGCWINVIPAGGLVLAPEQTRGCICPYPIKASVALYPAATPRAWSFLTLRGKDRPVRDLAVNLGAPGDRRDAQGVLWFGYPRPKHPRGYQFKLDVEIAPGLGYFRGSPDGAGITGTDRPWLYSAGCCGLRRLVVPLGNDQPTLYTVELHFAELADAKPGQRVFDIRLQDQLVARDFDIVAATGDPPQTGRAVVKVFPGVPASQALTLALVPKASDLTVFTAPVLSAIRLRQDR